MTKEHLATWPFILITFLTFIVFISFQILIPTLPLYIEHLGGSEALVGLVVGIFTAGAVLARPWTGRKLDRTGRRRVLLPGLGLFFLGSLSYLGAILLPFLFIIRVIHGLGWGVITTALGTVAADLVPSSRRAEGMGYHGMSASLGLVIGPALGLFILAHYGFQGVFLTAGMLSLLALGLAFTLNYPEVKVTAASSSGSLLERKAFAPSQVMFLLAMGFGGLVSFIALYMKDMGIGNTGLFFSVLALMAVIARPLAGAVADRKGYRLVIASGLTAVLLGLLIISRASDLEMLLAGAVSFGLGFGAAQPTLHAQAVSLVSGTRRGAANATFFSAFDLGIAAGAFSLGIVAQLAGYPKMFQAAVLIVLLALALTWKRKHISERDVDDQKKKGVS